jgi:cyclophilin family peptidyl-prolyl cis-trans isomerase
MEGTETHEFFFFFWQTPKTVENFRSLATGERGTSKKGTVLHYKGTSFHRIVQNMLIQGGDILRGKGKEGEVESIYGGAFAHERRNDTFDQVLIPLFLPCIPAH